MKIDTYQCDICGEQKGETNHWHRLFPLSVSVVPGISITAWINGTDADGVQHLCSDACVVKAVQAWLSAQKDAE